MLKITAPARICWDLSPVLPIRCEGETAQSGGAVITVVRLETGMVLCARVVLPRQGGSLDLREFLDVPWRDGTLLITLVHGNQFSNRAFTRLEKSERAFRDPEVEKFIARHRRHAGPLPVWPAAGPTVAGFGPTLPCYKRMSESPEVPRENGIVLAIRAGVVRGSFRLPLLDIDIVPPSNRVQDNTRFEYLRITAVIPITLLISGQGPGDPIPLDLRVPSYSEIGPAGRDRTANGFFAVDILQTQPSALPGRPGFMYALSGANLAGPVAVNV